MTPFDFVNSASYTKKNILDDAENLDEALKIYNPFLTNQAFSYFVDTIFIANELNMRPDMSHKMQYYCYLYGARKRKRYSKWHKADVDKSISDVSEYFHVNMNRAKEYIQILTPEQIQEISSKVDLHK